MIERLIFFLHKLRFIPVVLLIVASLFFLSLLLVNVAPKNAQARGTGHTESNKPTSVLDEPNVVATSMASAASYTGRTMSTALSKSVDGLQTAASATARSARSVASTTGNGLSVAAHGVGRASAITANAVGGGIVYVFQLPVKGIGLLTNAPAVSAIIKPAEHNEVPIIDPNSPELQAARKALPATQIATETTSQAESLSAWPLHGQITTQFGEPGPLYHPVHTGVDISDDERAGVTPVKSFRQGHVIEISQSGGLGNHVVVDHGSGVTSVYGHLASISVVVGQDVDTNTILGYEGTTGVSTGVHLHFEIRVNGQATDPHLFINGQP